MAQNVYFPLDVKVTRGDSRSIPLEFYDAAGDPEDVSTWDFFYTAKGSLEDPDADAIVALDPSDLVPFGTGPHQVTINLTEVHTDVNAKTYKHDVKAVTPIGTLTLAMGDLIIEDRVTIRDTEAP